MIDDIVHHGALGELAARAIDAGTGAIDAGKKRFGRARRRGSGPSLRRRLARAGLLAAAIAMVAIALERRMRRAPEVDNTMPGVPSDSTTMTQVVEDSGEAGYESQFVLLPDAEIRCCTCSVVRHASAYGMDALRRMEGASDPDDAVAVVALRCPACDAHGTMVLNYGPSGSPEEGDILLAMRDKRVESSVATGTAPGETEPTRT